MLIRQLKFLSVMSLVACGGAKPGSSSCTQAVSSSSGSSTAQFVPAGGFIAFADRGCTATFSLVGSDSNSMKLKAYTASHCSRDDKPENEKVSIAVYLPPSGSAAGGYIKNLPVRDEFYERRATFVADVRKLNNSRASYIAESLSKIPSFGSWWGFTVPSSEPLSPSQENINRNLCLLKGKTDETFSASGYRHCWSVFDTGMRNVELLRSDVGDATFNRLRAYLTKKASEQKAFLDANVQLRQQYEFWTRQIEGRMGAFRLLKYTKMAVFLNAEMCGKYLPAASPDNEACAVRSNLIEAASKYLTEVDYDGKKKNVFEKAKELGLGIDMAVPVADYYEPFEITEFQDDMESRADKYFIGKFNQDISALSQILQVKGNLLSDFSKNYFVSSNITAANSNSSKFSVVPFASISEKSAPVNAQGLSEYSGILKLYFQDDTNKLKFSKGDSGSMITIAGVVPLLALNTVNDEPTSGGASILALPEPESEGLPGNLSNPNVCSNF
ncbi:MAG: hypothetical protein RI953_3008 [Pseudomonadota bacterium]|jgi:hypothetical protein